MALSHNAPQLRIKSTLPGSGHVDGAWWPTSGDLAAALPDLLDQVGSRIGTVARVNFRLDEWSAGTARKLDRGSRPVRLDGYHNQPADTIYLIGEHNTRLVLLVVPASTDPDDAESVLSAAAEDHDTSTTEQLLATRVLVAT